MQFDEFFFCYKDIRRKAFFTMATLLMPLLENGYFQNDDSASEKKSAFYDGNEAL